jgi:hypothetical protein
VPVVHSIVPVVHSIVPVVHSIVPVVHSIVPVVHSIVPVVGKEDGEGDIDHSPPHTTEVKNGTFPMIVHAWLHGVK